MSSGFVYLRPLTVASSRGKGPYAQSSMAAWGRMFEWLNHSGMIRSTGCGYGLLLDDPRSTAPDQLRYDACVELIAGFTERLPADIGTRRLPGGAYARVRHTTGSNGLGVAISRLRDEWVPSQGLIMDSRRPIIEIYLDDPSLVGLEQLRVDICLPVKAQAEGEDRSAA